MFKPITRFVKKKYKTHKKWFIAALILDLLCIPATAQIIDKVSFSAPQKVASVKLVTPEAGLQRFVVASNAPFAVISENAAGDFTVSLKTKEQINGIDVGENAQLPGTEKSCATAVTAAPQKIYEAIRKTAKARGEVLSQAVIVEIRYDADLAPEFKILTQKNAFNIAPAPRCDIA